MERYQKALKPAGGVPVAVSIRFDGGLVGSVLPLRCHRELRRRCLRMSGRFVPTLQLLVVALAAGVILLFHSNYYRLPATGYSAIRSF